MRIILGSLWCYGNEWVSEVVKVILRKGPKWKIEKVFIVYERHEGLGSVISVFRQSER